MAISHLIYDDKINTAKPLRAVYGFISKYFCVAKNGVTSAILKQLLLKMSNEITLSNKLF